jgi:hypothetical protein
MYSVSEAGQIRLNDEFAVALKRLNRRHPIHGRVGHERKRRGDCTSTRSSGASDQLTE